MKTFYIASYSKYQTKAKIKEMLKASESNKKKPPIDLQDPTSGMMASPDEILRVTGKTEIVVKNPRKDWIGLFTYNPARKTWSFK